MFHRRAAAIETRDDQQAGASRRRRARGAAQGGGEGDRGIHGRVPQRGSDKCASSSDRQGPAAIVAAALSTRDCSMARCLRRGRVYHRKTAGSDRLPQDLRRGKSADLLHPPRLKWRWRLPDGKRHRGMARVYRVRDHIQTLSRPCRRRLTSPRLAWFVVHGPGQSESPWRAQAGGPARPEEAPGAARRRARAPPARRRDISTKSSTRVF